MTCSRLRGPDGIPIQVECGWSFSSALARSGQVYVWWPSEGNFGAAVTRRNEELDADAENRDVNKGPANGDGVIECSTWDIDIDPIVLPPLPALPRLVLEEESNNGGIPYIIQIAAYDRALIALTDQGHVLKFGSLANETASELGSWDYVS